MYTDTVQLPSNSRIGVIGEWCLRGGRYNHMGSKVRQTVGHDTFPEVAEFPKLCKSVLVFVDFFATSKIDSINGWRTGPEEQDSCYLVSQLLEIGLLKEIDAHLLVRNPGEFPFEDNLPWKGWSYERETFNEAQKKVAILNKLIDERHEPLYVGRPLPEYPNYKNLIVWRAVFDQFPLIGERVPIEDVLAYKSEARTRHLIRRIRQWVGAAQLADRTERELQEEIRDLLYQYEEHIKHTIAEKHPGTIEFWLKELEEVPRKLLDKDWSFITNSFKHRREYRSDLYKIEKVAPGAELAIILDAKRRFFAEVD